MKSRKVVKIKFLFLISLILFLLWSTVMAFFSSMSGIWEIIRQFKFSMLPAVGFVVLAYITNLTLWVFNWHALLSSLGLKTRLRDLYASALAGFFVDNVTPTIFVGGEIVMAYVLKRRSKLKVRLAKGLATVLFQMICWFSGTVLFAFFSFLLAFLKLNLPLSAILLMLPPLIIFSILFFTLVSLILNRSIAERFAFFIARRFKKTISHLNPDLKVDPEHRVKEWIETFHSSVSKIPNGRKKLAIGAITFLCMYLLETLSLKVLLLSVGEDINFITLMVALTLSVIVSLLSFVPGGIGVFEISLAGMLSLSGVEVAKVLFAITTHRLIFFWASTISGGVIAIKTGLETVKAKEAREVLA